MIDFTARAINAILNRFGVVVLRYPPRSSYIIRRQQWLVELEVSVLVDVGANVGRYALSMRREGYKGRIVSFEPLSAAFAQLQRTAEKDPSWSCRNFALGASDGEVVINIAGNSESSSLLQMNESHLNAAPESRYVGTERVRLAQLDGLVSTFCSADDSIWLKIDAQGYEKEVLEGSTRLLNQVQAIELELSASELYAGQPLIEEVVRSLRARGYVLSALQEEFLSPKGELLQMNGIFLRKSLPLKSVDESVS